MPSGDKAESKTELLAAIRRDSLTGGLSVRALARKYGVPRGEVREMLQAPLPEPRPAGPDSDAARELAFAVVEIRITAEDLLDEFQSSHPSRVRARHRAEDLLRLVRELTTLDLSYSRQPRHLSLESFTLKGTVWCIREAASYTRKVITALESDPAPPDRDLDFDRKYRFDSAISRSQHGGDKILPGSSDWRLALVRLYGFGVDVSGIDLSSLHCPDIKYLDRFVWSRETVWPDGISRAKLKRKSRARGLFQSRRWQLEGVGLYVG